MAYQFYMTRRSGLAIGCPSRRRMVTESGHSGYPGAGGLGQRGRSFEAGL